MANQRTQISEIGKYTLIKKLAAENIDDAGVIDRGDFLELVATEIMLEGIDFDLQYTPLEHLGRKAVVAVVSNIYAMNGSPEYISVSLGVSARFSVEEIEALYRGVEHACREYDVQLIGGNTAASLTGLSLALSCVGRVDRAQITRRSTACNTDLICVTGNLGAAYMGMKLLEREARCGAGTNPQFDGFKYLLSRQLKPDARRDVIDQLAQAGVRPTSMIDLSSGLASAALYVSRASGVGMRIYLDRLPIATETFTLAEQMNIDPVVAALNGGDDFELFFTVALEDHKSVLTMPGVDVVGHVVEPIKGVALTTPDGSDIEIKSPDFTAIQPQLESE